MWSIVIKAAIVAVLKWFTTFWERQKSLEAQRKLGRLEVTADALKKAADTEHEMAKVDATPSTADGVSDSLRDGKF